MNEDSLKRLKDAEAFFRKRNQTDMADQIQTCTQDLQSLHQELQTQTQALLQKTAPALSESVESTLKRCDAKLDEMITAFESKSSDLMHSKLAATDQQMEARIAETRLGQTLLETIKSELPQDLSIPARQILMEEAGPIWLQRWMMAMAGLMLGTLLITALILFSAMRAKSQIEQRTQTLSQLQSQIQQEQTNLTMLQSQTLGIKFFRTGDGMALQLPKTLRLRKASVDVRNAMGKTSGNTDRRRLYMIQER